MSDATADEIIAQVRQLSEGCYIEDGQIIRFTGAKLECVISDFRIFVKPEHLAHLTLDSFGTQADFVRYVRGSLLGHIDEFGEFD